MNTPGRCLLIGTQQYKECATCPICPEGRSVYTGELWKDSDFPSKKEWCEDWIEANPKEALVERLDDSVPTTILELGTRIRLRADKLHPCWGVDKIKEWCSHEGVVIGYGSPDEQGSLLQIAWSENCYYTLHIHERLVEVVGDTSFETLKENLNAVYFDRSEFQDILATPPLGKWRCKKLPV